MIWWISINIKHWIPISWIYFSDPWFMDHEPGRSFDRVHSMKIPACWTEEAKIIEVNNNSIWSSESIDCRPVVDISTWHYYSKVTRGILIQNFGPSLTMSGCAPVNKFLSPSKCRRKNVEKDMSTINLWNFSIISICKSMSFDFTYPVLNLHVVFDHL